MAVSLQTKILLVVCKFKDCFWSVFLKYYKILYKKKPNGIMDGFFFSLKNKANISLWKMVDQKVNLGWCPMPIHQDITILKDGTFHEKHAQKVNQKVNLGRHRGNAIFQPNFWFLVPLMDCIWNESLQWNPNMKAIHWRIKVTDHFEKRLTNR